MEEKSFRKLFEEAEKHDDYWISALILDFTENLHRLMKKKNIKKSELAKQLGTSAAYITKVLRGDANFTLKTMFRLAKAVGGNLQLRVVSDETEIQWVLDHANISASAPAFSPVSVVYNVPGRITEVWGRQAFSGQNEIAISPKPTLSLRHEEKTVNYAYATA